MKPPRDSTLSVGFKLRNMEVRNKKVTNSEKHVSLLWNPIDYNCEKQGRFSTVDLIFRVACFVKKENKVFNMKSSKSKLVSTRRSTVLTLPFQ